GGGAPPREGRSHLGPGVDGCAFRLTTSGDDTPSTGDDAEAPVGRVQWNRAVCAADDDILDPCAVAPGEVDAGFDAERHPLPERLRVALDQVRVLVGLEDYYVARPMDECLAVPAGRDDVAGRLVDRFAGDPRPND